jgi:GR25 family glycosyltransferase involved in LPS biosynthesis
MRTQNVPPFLSNRYSTRVASVYQREIILSLQLIWHMPRSRPRYRKRPNWPSCPPTGTCIWGPRLAFVITLCCFYSVSYHRNNKSKANTAVSIDAKRGHLVPNNQRNIFLDKLPYRSAFIVINLKRRSDRWSCVQAEFLREGVDPLIRYPAIDALDVFRPQNREKNIQKLPVISDTMKRALVHDTGINTGHLATFISHTSAMRSIAQREVKFSCIFEDDVSLKPGFVKTVSELYAELPEDWNLLLLNYFCHQAGCEQNDGLAPISKHLKPLKFFMSGAAYCMSSKTAKDILGTLPCEDQSACTIAVDGYLATLTMHGVLKTFGAIDLPVTIPQDLMREKNVIIKNKECFAQFDSDIAMWWRPGHDRKGRACVVNRLEKHALEIHSMNGQIFIIPAALKGYFVPTVERDTVNIPSLSPSVSNFHHQVQNEDNSIAIFKNGITVVVSSDLWRGVKLYVYNNGPEVVDLFWRHERRGILSMGKEEDLFLTSVNSGARYTSFLPNKHRILVGKKHVGTTVHSSPLLFAENLLMIRCEEDAKKY